MFSRDARVVASVASVAPQRGKATVVEIEPGDYEVSWAARGRICVAKAAIAFAPLQRVELTCRG